MSKFPGENSIRHYDKAYWCTSGRHWVNKGTEIIDKLGRAHCPIHKKQVRYRSYSYGKHRWYVTEVTVTENTGY